MFVDQETYVQMQSVCSEPGKQQRKREWGACPQFSLSPGIVIFRMHFCRNQKWIR